MRVVYFGERLSVHDRRFMEAYSEAGHEVLFLRLLPESADLVAGALPEGCSVLEWRQRPVADPGTYLAPQPIDAGQWVRSLAPVLGGARADLVHAGPLTTCAWLAAQATDAPLLAMSWGSDVLGDLAQEAWLVERARIALERATLVQCDNDAVRDRLTLGFGVPGDGIVEFPWGIDVERFSPGRGEAAFRSRESWRDATVVLSVRTWEPVYGIDTVISGFALAANRDDSLRLAMAADGSLRPQVERQIAEHGIEGKVELTGRIANEALVDVLRSSDIYVSASRSDGTSISLLEAMGAAVAPVVTDIPGNRQWVDGVCTGLLFPVGDQHALADRLYVLARDTAHRRAIGIAARKECLARADWRRNTADFFATIEHRLR